MFFAVRRRGELAIGPFSLFMAGQIWYWVSPELWADLVQIKLAGQKLTSQFPGKQESRSDHINDHRPVWDMWKRRG